MLWERVISGLNGNDEPDQRPSVFYPGLAARPVHRREDFGFIDDLEQAAPDIKRELDALRRAGAFTSSPASRRWAEGDWRQAAFYADGVRFEEFRTACPRTAAALDRTPGAADAGLAYFSILGPGVRVAAHCGPHNARLRCHLGLDIPPDCGLRVGAEQVAWENGKAIVFDDSFEHEAWNGSGVERAILIFDIWHPGLSDDEIAALKFARSPGVVECYDVACDFFNAPDGDGRRVYTRLGSI